MRPHSVLAIVLALLFSNSAAARDIRFAAALTFPSGASSPTRVWVADLNGDGIPDLVISDAFSSIAVLIGNGDGTFQAAVVYTEDFYVTGGVAIADFNGDKKLDLAVVGGDDAGNGLALFTGNGDGTFNPPVYSKTQLAGAAIVPVVGDFNGDGKADIFTGGNGSSEVLLGDNKGNFTSVQLIAASGDGVAIGDFNHDGIPDVAATNFISDQVTILLGNGDGTFQPPAFISVPYQPVGVACADFNNDGNTDLAVTLEGDASIQILLGKGDGTFATGGAFYAGADPPSVVAADFNLDKNIDLAVSDFEGGGITVLPGNGTGIFTLAAGFSSGNEPTTLVTADFNQDGSPDLAVTDYEVNNVAILLNEAGTFIHLGSSPNPSQAGQPVTFKAEVQGSVVTSAKSTGTVTFMVDNSSLEPVQLKQGLASLTISTLSKGKHRITALYSGDRGFNPNKSAVLVQTVE